MKKLATPNSLTKGQLTKTPHIRVMSNGGNYFLVSFKSTLYHVYVECNGTEYVETSLNEAKRFMNCYL